MARPIKPEQLEDSNAIHQYYQSIINLMPNLVYWLDDKGHLKGCNNNFLKRLGLKRLQDFSGTPYPQMAKFSHWSEEQVELFRREDMKVLYSGESRYDVIEPPAYDKHGGLLYYLSTRVPLFDDNKNVIGLVVMLVDITARKKMEEQLNLASSRGELTASKLNKGGLPRVLLVEDNLIAQKAEQSLLLALSCQVDIANSGDQAVMLFDPGKYSLVFMDISLEDTSGYIVAKRFRQMEKDTEYHVPIIALTGFEAEVIKYDCDEYSMEGALTKPLTGEQAKQAIQHYIYHKDIPVRGLKSIKESNH